jgi:uncharacterized membrane protein
MVKLFFKYLLGIFFILAGRNHFANPEFYYPLIPDYLPYPVFINSMSGIIEILLGLGILFKKYSKMSAWGIIVLLLIFIPSHIYFIQVGSCIENGLCVPEWIAWLRLGLIHPLLLYWAYIFTKD